MAHTGPLLSLVNYSRFQSRPFLQFLFCIFFGFTGQVQKINKQKTKFKSEFRALVSSPVIQKLLKYAPLFMGYRLLDNYQNGGRIGISIEPP